MADKNKDYSSNDQSISDADNIGIELPVQASGLSAGFKDSLNATLQYAIDNGMDFENPNVSHGMHTVMEMGGLGGDASLIQSGLNAVGASSEQFQLLLNTALDSGVKANQPGVISGLALQLADPQEILPYLVQAGRNNSSDCLAELYGVAVNSDIAPDTLQNALNTAYFEAFSAYKADETGRIPQVALSLYKMGARIPGKECLEPNALYCSDGVAELNDTDRAKLERFNSIVRHKVGDDLQPEPAAPPVNALPGKAGTNLTIIENCTDHPSRPIPARQLQQIKSDYPNSIIISQKCDMPAPR